jgi:hypothetical protein
MKRIAILVAAMMLAGSAWAQTTQPPEPDPQIQFYRELLSRANDQIVQIAAASQKTISSLQKQIADLQKQLADERAKGEPRPSGQK